MEEKELEKINTAKGMEKLFNTLKKGGLFSNYKNYKEWCEAKELLKDKLEVRK